MCVAGMPKLTVTSLYAGALRVAVLAFVVRHHDAARAAASLAARDTHHNGGGLALPLCLERAALCQTVAAFVTRRIGHVCPL